MLNDVGSGRLEPSAHLGCTVCPQVTVVTYLKGFVIPGHPSNQSVFSLLRHGAGTELRLGAAQSRQYIINDFAFCTVHFVKVANILLTPL